MSQAALFPSEVFSVAADPLDRTGFEIGWDHAHYRLVPPPEHLHDSHPVRQGWQAGQAVFGARTLKPTPAVRQWLQLRLKAWTHGQVFEGLQVTPHFLAQLQVPRCPVTLEPLTHDSGADTDAVVERACGGAGYAAGNLLVMSRRAAAAKGRCAWDEALRFAEDIERGHLPHVAGLGAAEWQRMAVLMSLATPLKHAQVASLPLVVLPPNRLRVLNPVQALQTLLTLLFTRPAYARQMLELAALMPSSLARQAYQVFMHTMLARRVAAGPCPSGPALRTWMAEAWTHPLVQRRWHRLALTLRESDCEHLVQLASRRGLWAGEGRWLPRHAATEGWGLESQGQAETLPAPPVCHGGSAAARSRARGDRSAPAVGGVQPHLVGLAGHAAL